jgi:hypothetical protein
MTGEVKMSLQAETLVEAIQMATERWRKIVSDPEADLPWSTYLKMRQTDDDDTMGGLQVEVLIELDRTLVDSVSAS